MGWVSYLHRAATTNYLCCGQALEDSLGAGRIGLTHTFNHFDCKGKKKLPYNKHSMTKIILAPSNRLLYKEKIHIIQPTLHYFLYFCKQKHSQPVCRRCPKGKGGKSGQHRALHFLTESCL